MSALIIVCVAALACYALRFGCVLALTYWSVPPGIEHAVRFVAPASIGALLGTTVATQLPAIGTAEALARLGAFCIAGVVTARTRNAVTAIAVGMPTLWALTWIS
jgi:branched-subunit amino acid transport protein